jgi:hypothetical protein
VPTLADRRRAGREAERQAHRDQLQQRNGQPTRKARPVPPREAELHQSRAPEQHPNASLPAVQQSPHVHQNPEGPRLR